MFPSRKKNRRRINTAEQKARLLTFARVAGRVLGLTAAGVVVVAAVAMGAQAGWTWAQNSPLFGLKGVKWKGLSHGSASVLEAHLGLKLGDNVVRLSPSALEKQLALEPWVASAKVTRDFPDRLRIDVVEQVALATLSLGDLYLVNADGLPFKRLQPGDHVSVPLVTGLSREDYQAHPADTLARVRLALEVIASFDRSPLAKTESLSEVRLDSDGIAAVLGDGVEARLGDQGFAEKLERLLRVRKELKSRSLEARVLRLDNRVRPNWVTVQRTSAALEKAPKALK